MAQHEQGGPQHGGQEQGEQLPKVKLTGRIGQVYDAELYPRKDGAGDTLVFKFSVAVHPDPDTTLWYKVVAFDDKAEALQQRFNDGELNVGQEIRVDGRLREQEYVSRRTGQPGIDRQVYPFNAGSIRVVPPAAPQGPRK